MGNGREVIHIALGTEACEVTSHLLNLYGLAATDGTCDPTVTHTTNQSLYVPRALLVDNSSVVRRPESYSINQNAGTWNGRIETVTQTSEAPTEPSGFSPFFDMARNLAESSYSRYQAPKISRVEYTSSNSRHVDWDNLGEEEEEDPYEMKVRMENEKRQWDMQAQNTQSSLDSFWSERQVDVDKTSKEHGLAAPEANPTERLSWREYLMPPYDQRSCLGLPLSPESSVVTDWNSYMAGAYNQTPVLTDWKQEQVWERIRHSLEESDSVQGFVIATQSKGIFAGICTYLLEELQEECPSSRKLVFALSSQDDAQPSTSQGEPSWHVEQVKRLRSHIETGLFYHGSNEGADAILPLRIPSGSRFSGSSYVAAALEACTLPYRVSPQSKSARIGLNSHYYGSLQGDSPFGYAPYLSLGEIINSLNPTSRHLVWELDASSFEQHGKSEDAWHTVLQGTSLERDTRMKQAQHLSGVRRPRDVEPGQWMLSSDKGGMLNSLSGSEDRRHHHHFALSSCVRTTMPTSVSQPQYINCLMEGMGIRFRPEQSIATISTQDIRQLTKGGYGTGSYWKLLWPESTPLISVLGNTSRSYGLLRELSRDFRQAISPRARGYFNRDLANGLLPEIDDCEEALSSCLNLADVYRPPDGSGIAED